MMAYVFMIRHYQGNKKSKSAIVQRRQYLKEHAKKQSCRKSEVALYERSRNNVQCSTSATLNSHDANIISNTANIFPSNGDQFNLQEIDANTHQQTNYYENNDDSFDEICNDFDGCCVDETSSDDDHNELWQEKDSLKQFQNRLAACFVNTNISHSQGDKILSVLHSHSCFRLLPKSIKTLLHTPRQPLNTKKNGCR